MANSEAAGTVLLFLMLGCGARTEVFLAAGSSSDAGMDSSINPGDGSSGESGPACTPMCTGKTCGSSDGCGGVCIAGNCVDAGSKGVLLFGGSDTTGNVLGDTWTWDGASWTRRDFIGPPARYGATMATLRDTVVLFGGLAVGDGGLAALDDTWTWDGSSWTRQDVAGPSARESAAMATLGDTVVLFGGNDEAGGAMEVSSDTWTWDGAGWTQPCVSESDSPSGRFGAAMATLRSTVVLFGGLGDDADLLRDTWTWNGTAWTRKDVAGPSARDSTAMATQNGTVMLFGGASSSGIEDSDTWTWNGVSWKAHHVTGPPARHDMAMFHAKRHRRDVRRELRGQRFPGRHLDMGRRDMDQGGDLRPQRLLLGRNGYPRRAIGVKEVQKGLRPF
jgi:N-acetylneuraminic acid mutarotase